MFRTARVLGTLFVTLLAACSSPGGRTADGGISAVTPEEDAGMAVVLPGEECNDFDDDADGLVDETCRCMAGDTKPCFPRSFEEAGRALCAMGTQACDVEVEFGFWGVCEDPVICEDSSESFVYGEETVIRPVDIVMVVDQSSSMSTEIASVKSNINGFAQTLAESGVDFHFSMLANRGTSTYDICVAPPLGGPGCADSERFHQLSYTVASRNALTLIQTHIDELESHMRSPSLRVFIVVTDDNSTLSAEAFDTWLGERGGYEGYVFNGIIGESTAICSGTASPGTVYIDLAERTDGIIERICSPSWAASFDRFANEIILRTLVHTLSQVPYDDIRVFVVDEMGGEREIYEGEGFRYDEASNAIILDEDFAPEAGAQIVVRYRHAI